MTKRAAEAAGELPLLAVERLAELPIGNGFEITRPELAVAPPVLVSTVRG